MQLRIPRDYFFDNPQPPQIFLCNTGKKIIGELPAYETTLDGKWNAYSELSFSIDRQYTDILTGETKINSLFDKTEGLRKVYVKNIGYFVIQDPDATYSDKDSKTITCFSSEYETGSKYLENFYINTGEIDSKEVMYLETVYGENYTIESDNLYTPAFAGNYDAYEGYYIKNYSDNDTYVYEQTQVKDEADYNSHFVGVNSGIPLYIKGYPNVRFYYPTNPKLSLLHLIFEKIPEWKIGNVDATLWHKERKFDEDRIAVYDFLMNEVSETFKCVVEWDTLTNTVNFYEEAEDGINDDNTIQTRWDTDVFISRDNLANEINISYSTDDIKTKLKVSGADDLDIREVNLGKNYIMNLDYYHTVDWMEQDLFDAYQDYLEVCEEYAKPYREAVKGRVEAYNQWNDLMHAVPSTNDVVLVGDEFKKLYCIYSPIDTAYLSQTLTDTDIDTLIVDNIYSIKDNQTAISKTTLKDTEMFCIQGYRFIYVKSDDKFKCMGHMNEYNLYKLMDKLNQYHVNQDIKGNESDNILLKLRNSQNDVVTIRIYDPHQIVESDYNDKFHYYTQSSDGKTYTEIKFKDATEYNTYKTSNTLYTNNYTIEVSVVSASVGDALNFDTYSLSDWIQGKISVDIIKNDTTKNFKLDGYTVSYIGIMGSYFVLAKDETREENIEDYGVNLLKEKHQTYITVFQTQTEAMFSQEKYQCIVQDEEPDGDFKDGTRWLDTNSNPLALYKYDLSTKTWIKLVGNEGNVTNEDKMNYENYQRYVDNYDKMVTVQKVLTQKETEAQYLLDGYKVSDIYIDINLYQRDTDGALRYNNQELGADLNRVAIAHFPNQTISGYIADENLPLYTFTTSEYPNKTFSVYVKGTTPYVAFEKSQGVYQAIMDYIAKETDFEAFFTEDQWIRLSPFIREDEFSDDNFLLTGYESEEERIEICTELIESADKELKTLSQPSLEFSMDMANILALPEFKSLVDQFQLGNFVRVYIRDGYLKRARLLEVHLTFDDLSDFSADFGNLITTKSEIDKHAELLSQAVTAGKQVAQAAGDWQRAVDKSNRLEEAIANGLQDAALEVGRASGQSIVWDSSGIWGRKLKDGESDQYEDEQFRIINNKLLFSNDGFRTSKAVFGKYTIDGEERWGPLAEYVTADVIEGKLLKGGSIEIGDKSKNLFIVHEDGSVEIKAAGEDKYAVKSAIDEINNAYQYSVELSYDGSTVFSSTDAHTIITALVKDFGSDITHKIPVSSTFKWFKNGVLHKTTTVTTTNKPQEGVINTDIDNLTANQINITHVDIEGNSFFSCQVDFDETKVEEGE